MHAELHASMDLLELKNRYQSLTDGEITLLWADKEGLTEIALSALKEEIATRKLGGDEFELRATELKQELAVDKQRLERQQRIVFWKATFYLAFLAIGLLIAIIKFFMK